MTISAKRFILFLAVIALGACAAKKNEQPPPPPKYVNHVVRAGDTLGAISSWYTGEFSNWKQLVEHNPGLRASRLRVGMVIQIPEEMAVRSNPMPKRKAAAVTTQSAPVEPAAPQEASPNNELPASPTDNSMESAGATEVKPEAAPAEQQAAAVVPMEEGAQPTSNERVSNEIAAEAVAMEEAVAEVGNEAGVNTPNSVDDPRRREREELLKKLLDDVSTQQ